MMVRFARHPVRTVFGDLADFERSVDSLFDTFMGVPFTSRADRFPLVDAAEYDDEFVIVAELPGVKKDDVKISVHNGTLTISGQRNQAQYPEDATWLRNELRTGAFTRSLTLPHEVQVDKVTAELSNGILRITLPKAEEARPRDIRVR